MKQLSRSLLLRHTLNSGAQLRPAQKREIREGRDPTESRDPQKALVEQLHTSGDVPSRMKFWERGERWIVSHFVEPQRIALHNALIRPTTLDLDQVERHCHLHHAMQRLKAALLPSGRYDVCKHISKVLRSRRNEWRRFSFVNSGKVYKLHSSTCDQHKRLLEVLSVELNLYRGNYAGVLCINKDYWTERVTFTRHKNGNKNYCNENAAYSGSFDWIEGNGLAVHLNSP